MNIIANLLNPVVLRQEISQASNPEFWFHALIVTVLAVAGFYFAFAFFKRARIIEDTPTSKIRSAAQGYVELVGVGNTLEGPAIVAPLTKTPCTWYRYKVEKLGDKNDHVVDSGTSEDLFVLIGETGRCVIDPEGAIVTPTVKRVWYGPHSGETGSNSSFGGLSRRYRFTEERIHPGDSLYAIGLFRSIGGESESHNAREEVRSLLAKWKLDQDKLLKHFDRNKDGLIDAQEWENVRKVASHLVRKNYLKRRVSPVTHILSKPEHANHPFLISTKPQHILTRHYKLYALGSFIGFLGAGSFAAWMFLTRF